MVSFMMSTPASNSLELPKKSRATSCTACRQVKLKCDLRQKYPNACSRCAANQHECKTDASFKRVPARSRIKELENQVNQLQRSQALSQVAPSQPEQSPYLPSRQLSVEHRLSYDSNSNYAASDYRSQSSPAASDNSHVEVKWLNISVSENRQNFRLEDVIVPYERAYDLFQHFENSYYPHFCILEPVTSLTQMYRGSPFLFWSILLVASRDHIHHSAYFDQVGPVVEKLYTSVAASAVRELADLQALLLLCSFPCPVPGQMRDPSFLRLGMAINAARQMGLDKINDEVVLGQRIPQHAASQHATATRHLTWMKCFELDVQMSCWYGHLPTLCNAQATRTVLGFCDSLATSYGYCATVNALVELSRALLAFEESLIGGGQSTPFLIRMFTDRLSAVRTRWSSFWTWDAEMELLTSKLYLYGTYLASVNSASVDRGDATYLEILHSSQATAVQLIHLLTNLSAETGASSGFSPKSQPLPGHPKSHFRSAFFAAIILLKYLDDAPISMAAESELESARNAFGQVVRMFSESSEENTSPEQRLALNTLEIAGRAIGSGKCHLPTNVTTRMAASLTFSAIWMANQIKYCEGEIRTLASPTTPACLRDPWHNISASTGEEVPSSLAPPAFDNHTAFNALDPTLECMAADLPLDLQGGMFWGSEQHGFGTGVFDGWQDQLPIVTTTTTGEDLGLLPTTTVAA